VFDGTRGGRRCAYLAAPRRALPRCGPWAMICLDGFHLGGGAGMMDSWHAGVTGIDLRITVGPSYEEWNGRWGPTSSTEVKRIAGGGLHRSRNYRRDRSGLSFPIGRAGGRSTGWPVPRPSRRRGTVSSSCVGIGDRPTSPCRRGSSARFTTAGFIRGTSPEACGASGREWPPPSRIFERVSAN